MIVARTVRAGPTEAGHYGSAVAVDRRGRIIGAWGDASFPVYYRSAIKPFQATASQEAGAALAPEPMAVACASHGGQPVHVEIVRDMLAEHDLDESALRCPAGWPLSRSARDRLIAAGATTPRPIYHNCSGKHAGFLRACAAAGWPIHTYLRPDHPLQQSIVQLVADVTGAEPDPIGVDGCGAPVLAGTIQGLATGFARLDEPRYADAARAMSRFPALVADSARPDGRLAAWWGGPLKVGAQGIVAASRHGIGIAVKSHEGSRTVAVLTLIEVMRQLGLLPGAVHDVLADVARPPVLGGGGHVGAIETTLEPASAS